MKPAAFVRLLEIGISMDMIYLLENPEILNHDSIKIQRLRGTMIRKGLITPDNELTESAKRLLKISDSDDEVLDLRPHKKVDFERWWNAYPPTDSFEINGIKFTGSRALRLKKNECKAIYESILLEGKYSEEEMIKALEMEVEMKKRASLKERKNKLSYMQNSFNYLMQRSFEGFIEVVRNNIKIEEVKSSSNETFI
jgi:hypothetical protein